MKTLFFGLFWGAIFLAGCANLGDLEDENSPHFMKNLSQNALDYVARLDSSDSADSASLDSHESRESTQIRANFKKEYLRRHFEIWDKNYAIPSPQAMFWGLNVSGGFDESKREIQSEFYENLAREMQVAKYPLMRRKAIMTKSASVRVLPTIKPRFSKIDGYPFDRLQNSYIFAQTPVLALQSDVSGEWILIQSSFVSGWVKSDEVAFLSEKDARFLREVRDFVLPMSDKITLKHRGAFVENARIGMILPRVNGKILAFQREINGEARRILIDFKQSDFAEFPLIFSEQKIAEIITQIGAQNYGWGGMYGNRDCSSFLRDVFANFGVWMPRNSLAQVEFGKVAKGARFMKLPGESAAKLAFVREFGVPFRTILWMKGHIMLYIGAKDGEPLALHQVWGISDARGSEIISRVSITTLTPKIDEANRVSAENEGARSLLERIEAMNILF